METEKKKTTKKKKISDPALKKVVTRVNSIIKERPSHKEILTFYKKLATEKAKIKPKIKVDSVAKDKHLIEVKMREGFPLIDKRDIIFDVTSATTLFTGLCELLKRHKKISKDACRIHQAFRKGELNLRELLKKGVAEDSNYINAVCEKLELKREIIDFLVENSLTPIFEAHAKKLKDHVDQERWWRSYCPICGSKPVMAALRGPERKRFLVCSCCGYEWRFMRLKCPFCENEEQKRFRFFYTEKEGKVYRVETCDKCKKYIKTVDTEELDEDFIPSVEDVGTLYLDVLAQTEGYTRELHQMGLSLGG